MNHRKLLCYAQGTDKSWEAICVDLDIAVQGASLPEVFQLLNEAVATYVEDAMNEAHPEAERLLNRRAPWHIRVSYVLGALWHVITRRTRIGSLIPPAVYLRKLP